MVVLVIDDDASVRLLLRAALKRAGTTQLHEADNGQDGVMLAQRELPDIILLDVMMPGMDGMQTLQALRQYDATADTPVVFMSASVSPTDLERFEKLDVAGVIAKPFSVTGIADQLRSVLASGERTN